MKISNLKFLTPILLAGALMGATSNTTITVKGSDTMVILAQRWAEAYMAKNPGSVIQVTGGGSGTGISALINGTTDICNASRPMKSGERAKLKERYATLGVEIKAAKDGLSMYVHESNPVKTLSLPQVKAIYQGKITNWKELGGPDAKIIVYGRENNSGTYVFFKDNVLGGGDFLPSMLSMPGTAAVVNAVSKDKNGIGFGGAAYAKGIHIVPLKKDDKSPAIEPTAENIKSGAYPLSRFLYLYTANRPTGAVKEYIDWILSPEGQALAVKVGYFPAR
jgi:phosphate transport system substrate-binding protein